MSRLTSIFRNLRLILSREITEQIGEVEARLNQRSDAYERAIDQRLDERSVELDRRLDERETTLDRRLDEREITLDRRLDERQAALDQRLDERFDERTREIDLRLDDRFARNEKRIDEKFIAQDHQLDERMERHERKVDAMIRQFSTDIVERNDVMLQLFEQRLDKQRRELKALRESSGEIAQPQAETGSTGKEDAESADDSHSQLISFRKLANVTSHATTKIKQTGAAPLYHQILDWKKVAHEELDKFSSDEQEVVDYILSFVSDEKELHYVRQHLRRFVATLQRIPPAQKSSDRLLELGSLSHIAPAIKKYSGYNEVHCADFWESDQASVVETVTQRNGNHRLPETHTFELRNFNVERDVFPYPENHFRVVLCCELIEHLQSDPMHMLWECNRVLENDGWLLLTTPNIASCRAIEGLLVGCAPYLLAQYNVRETVDQHNREYAPYEVGVALAAAGFEVVELETEDVWARSNPAILDLLRQVHIGTELRGDNIFALAKKTSAPVERYPKELYID
ncbi:MAG: methyltransferase domain-containing protein [Acidobacteria bacterium]|nr:methyltransferase domain-containing protein [Acidobacteriota bacterium]